MNGSTKRKHCVVLGCCAALAWISLTAASPGDAQTPKPPKHLIARVDRDDPEGMRILGQFYWRYSSDPEAMKKAAFWFDRAASMDDHPSQAIVSVLYEKGLGVPQSAERAAWFAMHATRSGDSKDQVRYAQLLESGYGLPPEAQEARQWYRRAADQGHSAAARWLGEQLARDTGNIGGVSESVRYLAIAARQGDQKAASTLARLSARFSPVANARPNVNIRKSPSLNADVVARTSPVSVMYVLGQKAGGWVEVYRPEGYVTGYAFTRALIGG